MDVISMHQAKVINAVASLGTALTERQMSLASRYAEELVLFFDSDDAGQNAAIRGLKMLMLRQKNQGVSSVKISVGMVPDGKDPDEYIRLFGADAFQKAVSEALPVMEYLILTAKKQSVNDGKFDARTYQTLACTYLSWENNAVLRERAAGQVAQVLGVSVASVLAETDRKSLEDTNVELIHTKRETSRQMVVKQAVSADSSATHQELVMLCLLCRSPEVYAKMRDKPIMTDFSAGNMRVIASTALNMLDKNSIDIAKLLDIVEDKEINQRPARELLTEIIMKTKEIRDEKKLLKMMTDYLYRVRLQVYTNRKRYLAEQMDGMLEGNDRDATIQSFREVNEYLKFLREKIKESSA
jgi:DNA primase